ncbi:XRCC4-like factor-domain-containing protein [Massariosphaeria phaeospora]|uniref:Non-homologous end-joining factor 1 n=1 Tax=Massariosphaeria phaeospora TaxID=100035 RepID=A0A7C8IJP3_9PLEO|nr:XRCC4-like factor-domain-containing protein [Massariosphaeria phaeospora]
MSCWRVLELSDPAENQHIPQLLIKPVFEANSYSIHLTDLSNIWSEELDLSRIVDRALEEESPIEISKHDTAQLDILLENVRKSLSNADGTLCRITRNSIDGVTLHTTVSLPEPLDSLRWKFYLGKRTSDCLKSELILPLLVSSHIQHARVSTLIGIITEKDKVITRLMDTMDSSNLDLANAFPSLGGSKLGRRAIKREQAARHVPALQPFQEEPWRYENGRVDDAQMSTLGLFQEALSDCTPKVPPRLKAEKNDSWWSSIRTSLNVSGSSSNRQRLIAEPQITPTPRDVSDDETEDEFETHENFKLRETLGKRTDIPGAKLPPALKPQDVSEDETTEDDDDLDAPVKGETQSQLSSTQKLQLESTPPPPEPSHTTRTIISPRQKPKSKGFRIGGAKKPDATPLESVDGGTYRHEGVASGRDTDESIMSASQPPPTDAKTVRRPFRIGGKHQETSKSGGTSSIPPASTKATQGGGDPAPERVSAVNAQPSFTTNAQLEARSPMEEEREETPEEKAERKRLELKRKNEELAKKQAQSKKKKRF